MQHLSRFILPRFALFLVIVGITTISLFAVQPEMGFRKGDDETAIRRAVERYMHARGTAIQSLKPPDFTRFTTRDVEGLTTARREAIRIDYQVELQRERDFGYDSYDVTVDFASIEFIATDEVQVEIVETQIARTDLSPDILSTSTLSHVLRLRKTRNMWLVASDIYTDDLNALLFESDRPYVDMLADLRLESAELQREQSQFLQRAAVSNETTAAQVSALLSAGFTKEEIEQTVLQPIRERLKQEKETRVMRLETAEIGALAKKRRALNHSKSVKYAHRWANDRNPAYGDFKFSEGLGGDCTNFVSQVFHAGGAPEDRDGSWIWFYDAMNPSPGRKGAKRSPSWSGVTELNSYLTGNTSTGPIGRETSYDTLVQADLVQLKKGSKWFHSGVVVSAEWKWSWKKFKWVWEVLVASHEDNHDNYNIDNWSAFKKRYLTISYYD